MEDIKVSVLTPVYNTEKYVRQAIESILNQTFKDFEYIIVDDCSTERTWEIVQEYASRDSRIKVFKNEKNLYIAGNRNVCLTHARGKYIAWQDSDDISMLGRLEKQFNFMENHPEVGIVGGYLQFFNDSTNKTSIRKYATDDKTLRKNIFRYSPVGQPGAMVRKKCLDEVGSYDPETPPAEDLDMSFRIGKNYKFANIPEVVVKYREFDNNATFTRLKTIELRTIEIRKKYARSGGYKMTLGDKIYNFLQHLSIYIIPPKLKIKIFNLLRNS